MSDISSSTGLFQNFSQLAQQYRQQIEEEAYRQDLQRIRSGQRPVYDDRYSSTSNLDQYQNLYERLLGIENEQTRGRMSLANFYRTQEGETAGQRDEQAFRRLSSQLNTQKEISNNTLGNQRFLQQRGQELVNWQRDMDYNRANAAVQRYQGMRTGSAMNYR